MDEQTTQQTSPKRHGLRWFTLLLIIALIAGAFRMGYVSGKKGFTVDAKTFRVINQEAAPTTVDYGLLWEAIATLNEHYIEKPVDDQQILYGAVKGAVAASGDPYTQFFTPEELEEFRTDLKGSFDGIGAELGKKGNNLIIIAPLDGSPAKAAGLRAQDIIVKVNGEFTTDWSVEQAVKKIRGQKGTQVTLTIFRDEFSKPQDITITRDTISVKSVKWEVKDAGADGQKKKIGLITLSRFGDDTEDLFERAVRELTRENVRGIVLDLRNDPGGYLETATDIASFWVPKDALVVTEAVGTGKNNEYRSKGYGALSHLKTIVLINGGSASAAEILAGALRDHNLATLVGEKSFGKGSVQTILDLPGKSALKVTVAKWITPGGRNLNKEGLTPDIEIKLSEEDIKNQKDPQIDKALEEVVK